MISARSVQTLANTSAADQPAGGEREGLGSVHRGRSRAPHRTTAGPRRPEMSALAAVNGKYWNTSWTSADPMPSAMFNPMTTPMPAIWLRATVAIAKPSAPSIENASRPRQSK